jgi:RNA-directed DNA polymerase
VRKTYFRSAGHRPWVFTGEIVGKGGHRYPVQLFSALRMPIKRHTKVQQKANPYDPAWEDYFEARLSVTMNITACSVSPLLR